jgi:hypothetical protein
LRDEIDLIIKEMPSDRAPGPDGFNGMFLKKCWGIIKEDFHTLARQFYNCTLNLQNINVPTLL